MKNISAHITFDEATKSPTAIRNGIDNKPNETQLAAMQLVAEKCFEPLREWYGKPIKINSFFRCDALNKKVGGSATSEHVKGMAMDIDAGADNKKIFDWCKENLTFTQLLWEFGTTENPDWVHISYNPANLKKQILVIK